MYRRLVKDQPVLLMVFLSLIMILTGCGQQQVTVKSNNMIEREQDIELIDSEARTDGTGENTAESAKEQANAQNPLAITRELEVHYIDVGQGDATLLQGPDFTLLIDAGRQDKSDVVSYLRNQGVSVIDLLILTHPHADHIGQADVVIQEFNVNEVWMSGDEHNSQTFERVLDAILASEADYHEPRAGEAYQFGSSLVEVYHPNRLTGDLHEGSIMVRLTYGDIKFLFTGDAEKQTERELLSRGHDLEAHIFQLGHHGSTTSNTQAFLNAVQAEVAIYSAREGNSYGHPHEEIIERIKNMETELYGTDVDGHIIVTTDGTEYTVLTNKDNTDKGTTKVETKEEAGLDIDKCININIASMQDLTDIIHIGEARANVLIQMRPFSAVDELNQIHGIGPARLVDIKDQGLACVQ